MKIYEFIELLEKTDIGEELEFTVNGKKSTKVVVLETIDLMDVSARKGCMVNIITD